MLSLSSLKLRNDYQMTINDYQTTIINDKRKTINQLTPA